MNNQTKQPLLSLLLIICISLLSVQASVDKPPKRGQEISRSHDSRNNPVKPGYQQAFSSRPPKPSRAAGALGGSSGGASSSNASNYGGGSSISVNPRTGSVSLEAELFNIHGINEDIDLSFALTYQGEDAVSDQESTDANVFGLPPGWSVNLSYLENKSTYFSVNIDGSQQYVYDTNWRSYYLPSGSENPVLIASGLKEYNRADSNIQTDNGSVTVNNIKSALLFASMNGNTRYLSGNGLLLQESDRFANTLQYYYNADVTPVAARLTKIVDSWDNEILFSYCNNGELSSAHSPRFNQGDLRSKIPQGGPGRALASCTPGEMVITLPDGRTVGWVVSNNRLTQIIDAQGKVTDLSWATACNNYTMLSGATSAAGSSTAVRYQCMKVCTQASSSGCTSTRQWPVAQYRFDCPSYPGSMACPSGQNTDFLTSHFDIGGTSASKQINNYTGYPFYSPYADNADPAADALMQSNDKTFKYITTVSQKNSSNITQLDTEYYYNFLHLETQSVHHVLSDGSLKVAKVTANCYDMTGNGTQPGCPDNGVINYASLPANYQSATMTGSCIYDVSDASSNQARLSIVSKTFDSFGNTLNRRAYHGTTSTGILSNCDTNTILNPTPLQVVIDSYLQYDTPSQLKNNYLVMGKGSGHYGLMAAAQTYIYLDPDDDSQNDNSTPVAVTLVCNALTTDSGNETAGTAVKSSLFGALPLGTAKPTTPGVIDACSQPGWDESVAPPKLTTYSYDANGRPVSIINAWGGSQGATQPGITSVQTQFAFALTTTKTGEDSCQQVLQKTKTDDKGHQTITRACVDNSFFLSRSDEQGRTVFYQHDETGLTTRVTEPNGNYKSFDYYYACPKAPDGNSETCPSTTTAKGKCPYGDQSPPRSCMVQTLSAGTDPVTGIANTSYVDGVMSINIKDGMGRSIQAMDNLGSNTESTAYNSLQTRSISTYNDLNLLTTQSSKVGTITPLTYTTTTQYGPKQRPKLACDPHGVSHQFVHDDIGQHVKRTFNGHQVNRISMNDAHKLTAIKDCPIVGESTQAGSGCPATAVDTSSADCSGNFYLTEIGRDGAGNQRSVTASDPNAASSGASIASVTGTVSYSADLMKYSFNLTGTATSSGQSVTASTRWARDLHGITLGSNVGVNTPADADTFASSQFTVNSLGNQLSEINALSSDLTEDYVYTPTRRLENRTDYAGTTFYNYYDNMDRLVRHCYPGEDSGTQGEKMVLDAMTSKTLSVTHFTNTAECSSCSDGSCGDVDTATVSFAYTPFGAIISKTYLEGTNTSNPETTQLNWAYDEYQRPVCFADAVATLSGHNCPASPVASSWTPTAEQQLSWFIYWPDSDTYRRGMLQSACRGVAEMENDKLVYDTQCINSDYYTSEDTDGACDQSSNPGAYASLIKTSSLCDGGVCDSNGDNITYQTTYTYDAHRRSCSTQTRNNAQNLILGSTYSYDQYDNVMQESHQSDLDNSTDSNYKMAYIYDGMMRLIKSARTDIEDDPVETYTYEYDAASNITKKVKTTYE